MKRFTLLLNVGSSKEGELHQETPAGYMRNRGPAVLCRDGWLAWGNGLSSFIGPESFRVQVAASPSLTDRVVAEVLVDSMARAKALLGDRFAARRVA